ncbi:MAG: SPFH domain-containing protein [Streptosporangiaceae bacterium]
MAAPQNNSYLDQVVAQQAVLEGDLKARPYAPAASPMVKRERALGGGAADARTNGAVDVRITGFWRWKTVLVPPNAFVVHTRRGRAVLDIGLGTSFRFNPATDAFLVVPGATQTILINAYCICRELQGVLVQGYVQWIIQDFPIAYRKLDFSDSEDPMRLVNLQLKEQAEAAIKDKVSTMSVRDVLSDKQPIIEELTARLRAVAEGEGDSDQGLGLRIVTVQIKEAVVSSSRLWENLQKPYRAEQARIARLAELESEEVVSEREMSAARVRESRRIENEREVAELQARNGARLFDTETVERLRRTEREHDDRRQIAELDKATQLHALQLERDQHAEQTLRIQQDLERRRLELEGELALELARTESAHQKGLLALDRDRVRAAIENEQTPESILVRSLPQIVEKLPKPDELRSVTIGGNDSTTVAGLVAELTGVIAALRSAQ